MNSAASVHLAPWWRACGRWWQPFRPFSSAIITATGPSDETDSGIAFFVHTIGCARSRIWLTSPYFVPQHPVLAALGAARLGGVDVKIILPARHHMLLTYLAAFAYLAVRVGRLFEKVL